MATIVPISEHPDITPEFRNQVLIAKLERMLLQESSATWRPEIGLGTLYELTVIRFPRRWIRSNPPSERELRIRNEEA